MQPPLSLTNVPLHGHPPHHTGHCGTQTLCSGLYHATRLLHTCASHICARARGQLIIHFDSLFLFPEHAPLPGLGPSRRNDSIMRLVVIVFIFVCHMYNYVHAGARHLIQPAGGTGLNIEFEHGFGGKLRWLIRLQTGI